MVMNTKILRSYNILLLSKVSKPLILRILVLVYNLGVRQRSKLREQQRRLGYSLVRIFDVPFDHSSHLG
jgi:hypothetical protein